MRSARCKRPRVRFSCPIWGESGPLHNDSNIRGAFSHLDHGLDQVALTRVVLEGVTHAIRDSFDALSATGTQINRLIAVGGGSKSDYWVKAIATALDIAIDLPAAGDFGGAFGAAWLGMMAATGAGAEIATRPQIARTIAPDTALTGAFTQAHARYRDSYVALKGLT